MNTVEITDEIVMAASGRVVWDAITDPTVHAEWHPFVESIEGEHALGASRRCAVRVGKKGGETVERCTAYDERRRIAWQIDEDSTGFLRLVADWTAGFALEPTGVEATRVRAQSVFRPRNPLLVLAMPIVRRKFHQTQQAILAALQQSVEQPRARTAVELETG
jgi:carbon monoxide dehydrogenase subunit G